MGCVCAQETALSYRHEAAGCFRYFFSNDHVKNEVKNEVVREHVVSTFTVQGDVFVCLFCYSQTPVAYYFGLFCVGTQAMTWTPVV